MAILANPRTPFEARLEVHERSFERGCDNITIPLKYAMMIYCIIKKMVVNLGAIIRNSIFSLMKEPIVVVSFPYIIEALCLKAISELLAFLQAPIPGDGEEENCGEEKEVFPPPPLLKRKNAYVGASSSQRKEKKRKLDASINPKPLAILLPNSSITSSKIQIL
ncbi:hypothetical protein E6C27_scaffold675G00930 [Cucumis melo var. makuwa]|uniref:Uncharacterized protein n=1 Tax=Cucumis melo var. makuwa TaxID=1194695 RepID=A0A5A7U6V5_CUCMM|nr:hypothetical protein E6C27_scaffold675G00930 [Cucumis melo var. makuwa]